MNINVFLDYVRKKPVSKMLNNVFLQKGKKKPVSKIHINVFLNYIREKNRVEDTH